MSNRSKRSSSINSSNKNKRIKSAHLPPTTTNEAITSSSTSVNASESNNEPLPPPTTSEASSSRSASTKRKVVKKKASQAPPVVRETISLPAQETKSTTIQEILDILEPLAITSDLLSKYPIIIGSRAASYWIPSFRTFKDWNIIATPSQARKMVHDLQAYNDRVSISLICQPLDKTVIRRSPITPEVQDKIDTLPSFLYKVCGEIKDGLKFEIEIVPVNEQGGDLLTSSSAAMLLDLCNNEEQVLLDFPIGSHPCIVASLEILEALKTSHIIWPAYFSKHIADLHTLRTFLPPTASTNLGIRADKKKPLTPPERAPVLQSCLLTRTLEVEAFRGTPGAHINPNVSNEDVLVRDDDLSVTGHIPHDEVRKLVKYGDSPIYDQLKTDTSMVSKELFERAPYDTQLKYVKEEAMVFALERFLLPGFTSDSSSAYKSALARICTHLTKGWFREFAIDNFPRLAVCDKDLVSIRDEILNKYPLPPETKAEPLERLKATIPNLEELVLVQKLMPLTEKMDIKEVKKLIAKDKRKRRALLKKQGATADTEGQEQPKKKASSGGRRRRNGRTPYGNYRHRQFNESFYLDIQTFWVIQSSARDNHPVLICFEQSESYDDDVSTPGYTFRTTLSVQVLNADTDLVNLQDNALWRDDQEYYSFHAVGASVESSISTGLGYDYWDDDNIWYGEDIWGRVAVKGRPIQAQVLQELAMENLTEDLLMKFIIALVNPSHFSNGDTPFVNGVNKDKGSGLIPHDSKNHLYYDLWKYKGRQ